MKLKGGRPKNDPTLNRGTEIKIRCCLCEKDDIKALAKSYGLTMTDYVLKKCLDQRLVFNHVEYLKEIHELNLEIARQGNNINQLAKYANTLNISGKLNSEIAEKLTEILSIYSIKQDEIRSAFRRLIREMSK